MKKYVIRISMILCVFCAVIVAIQINTHAAYPTLNHRGIKTKVALKTKLKVRNYSGNINWKSKNKKVATVSENGVVIGRKKGKTYIVAKLKSGEKLSCYVKVSKNEYIVRNEKNVGILRGRKYAKIRTKKLFYNSKRKLCITYKITNPSPDKTYVYDTTEIRIKSKNKRKELASDVFELEGTESELLEPNETVTMTLSFRMWCTDGVVDLSKWVRKNGLFTYYGTELYEFEV